MAVLQRPQVEGMYVELEGTDAAHAVQRAQAALGGGWVPVGTPRTLRLGGYGVELARPEGTIQPAAAWELAAWVATEVGGLAEPLIGVDWTEVPDRPPVGPGAIEEAFLERAPDESDWNLTLCHVQRAWARFGARQPGAGVRVGHVDTGVTRHPELLGAVPERLRLDLGLDLVDGQPEPIDPLDPGFADQPGHGTSTASVLMSPADDALPGSKAMAGVAPGVEVVPIRVSRSVIMTTWQGRMARALDHAVAQGCHVVTISMGGLGSTLLRRAVDAAADAGVIVVAAAGNFVGFTVWPANYDTTIAAAACGPEGVAWVGSSRGQLVDVTAPGHQVWRARWRQGRPEVWPSSGTSFATPTVAGTAALWLSLHGVSALRARYPGRALVQAFRTLIRATCTRPVRGALVVPGHWGSGLLDADALLAADLPAGAALEEAVLPAAAPPDALDRVVAMLEDEAVERRGGAPLPRPAREVVAAFLGIDPAAATGPRAAQAAEELLFHLGTDEGYRGRLVARIASGGEEDLTEAVGASPSPVGASSALRDWLGAPGPAGPVMGPPTAG